MSVSSSTALADHAANTLMAAAARSVGAHDAARAFWYRTFRQAWMGGQGGQWAGFFQETVRSMIFFQRNHI